jgi:uncharacterized RDD family membrane protein YckC
VKETASTARRFLAITLDWLMSWAVTALIFQSFLGLGQWVLLVFFSEVVILTSLQGASAGQRILKIQVLTWPDQDFVNPLRILFRTLLICLVIPAVITDMQSRGLHDRFAKTVVVKN